MSEDGYDKIAQSRALFAAIEVGPVSAANVVLNGAIPPDRSVL
jgi:hypothetical protein